MKTLGENIGKTDSKQRTCIWTQWGTFEFINKKESNHLEVGQTLRRFNREHSQLENKPGKMLNSISHWGNAHLNHKEMPRETPRPARVKVERLQIPRVFEHWDNWKSHTWPVGMPNGAATVENSLSVS